MPRNSTRGAAARARGSATFPHSRPRSTAMLAQTSPRDWPPISCNARRPRIFLYPPKLPPFQTLGRLALAAPAQAHSRARPRVARPLRRLLFPVQPGAEIDGVDGRNVFRARAKMAVVEPHARPAAPPAAVAVRPRAGRLHVQPPALPEAVLARRAEGDQPEAPATRARFPHGERRSTALDLLPARPRRAAAAGPRARVRPVLWDKWPRPRRRRPAKGILPRARRRRAPQLAVGDGGARRSGGGDGGATAAAAAALLLRGQVHRCARARAARARGTAALAHPRHQGRRRLQPQPRGRRRRRHRHGQRSRVVCEGDGVVRFLLLATGTDAGRLGPLPAGGALRLHPRLPAPGRGAAVRGRARLERDRRPPHRRANPEDARSPRRHPARAARPHAPTDARDLPPAPLVVRPRLLPRRARRHRRHLRRLRHADGLPPRAPPRRQRQPLVRHRGGLRLEPGAAADQGPAVRPGCGAWPSR